MTLQDAVRRRLLDSGEKDDAEKQLVRMLITLEAGGFITLEPAPPNHPPHLSMMRTLKVRYFIPSVPGMCRANC